MFRNESMKQLEATGAAALEPSDQSGGNLKQRSWGLRGEASSQPLSRLAKQRTAGDAGKPVCILAAFCWGQAPVSQLRLIPSQAMASNRAIPEGTNRGDNPLGSAASISDISVTLMQKSLVIFMMDQRPNQGKNFLGSLAVKPSPAARFPTAWIHLMPGVRKELAGILTQPSVLPLLTKAGKHSK